MFLTDNNTFIIFFNLRLKNYLKYVPSVFSFSRHRKSHKSWNFVETIKLVLIYLNANLTPESISVIIFSFLYYLSWHYFYFKITHYYFVMEERDTFSLKKKFSFIKKRKHLNCIITVLMQKKYMQLSIVLMNFLFILYVLWKITMLTEFIKYLHIYLFDEFSFP